MLDTNKINMIESEKSGGAKGPQNKHNDEVMSPG